MDAEERRYGIKSWRGALAHPGPGTGWNVVGRHRSNFAARFLFTNGFREFMAFLGVLLNKSCRNVTLEGISDIGLVR